MKQPRKRRASTADSGNDSASASEREPGKAAATVKTADDTPRCGLCGSTKNLTRTECCGRWICDDEDKYVLFSYADNSCSRNHRRYTLCGYHHTEGHKGRWQDCPDCHDFETEMYVWYGTNEYNFEKLENPPSFRPTFCHSCHRRIHLGTEAHTIAPDGTYYCEPCGARLGRSR